jgi:3-hydroxyisobutyrate dehydrogenase-like beta-hydroxyacid dehydrogenase
MVQRLMKAGHEYVVSDTHPQAVKDVVAKGANREQLTKSHHTL